MNTVTPRHAREQGTSRTSLHRAVQAGRIEKIARGIYLPDKDLSADWDWLEAATRRPDATVCLTTALAYHDLTDTIPSRLDVAIPRGARVPATEASIAWHLFDRLTFTIGREEITIPGSSTTIGMYSAERCIADAFRLRGAVGYETGLEAIEEWLRRGGKPADLMSIASLMPRAKSPIIAALQAYT